MHVHNKLIFFKSIFITFVTSLEQFNACFLDGHIVYRGLSVCLHLGDMTILLNRLRQMDRL